MIFTSSRYTRLSIVLICATILCWGCTMKAHLPVPLEETTCHKVKVGPGPEDFVLDTRNGGPRLLISSHDRRNFETSGDIYFFDIDTDNDLNNLKK